MIQPTELRIGNLIQLIYQSKRPSLEERIVRVDRIDEIGVEILENGERVFGASYELLEPIPLTEEILLKCGFEKEPISYSINIDSFGGGKRLSFSGDYLYITDSEKQNTIPTDIITLWNKDLRKEFYLHELQNIFHAITGTELNITL